MANIGEIKVKVDTSELVELLNDFDTPKKIEKLHRMVVELDENLCRMYQLILKIKSSQKLLRGVIQEALEDIKIINKRLGIDQ